MFWVIDRFEEDWCVLISDARESRRVPRHALPETVRAGDALREKDDGYVPDPAETCARAARIRDKWARLKGKP